MNVYANVNIGVQESLTGEQIKLEVDDMLSSLEFNAGDIIMVGGERRKAWRAGTMVKLKGGRNVYLDCDATWLRNMVKEIKGLAKKEASNE